MTADNNEQRSLILGGSLVLVAAGLLFIPQMFFTPFAFCYRTTNQVLLILGRASTTQTSTRMGNSCLNTGFGDLCSRWLSIWC
jgi:hypothetical protein